jgi:hypothetical protein
MNLAHRFHRVIAALLFLGAALIFFSSSFPSYFVCDDYEFLGRITPHNAGEYFGKSWGYGNEYRPLLVYTYAWNGALSGFDPAGYHACNTLMHALNAIVLALILEMLGFSSLTALLAAMIFALNPVTHQSVLWIAGRPVILSTLFVLLSISFFLKAVRRTERRLAYWIGTYLTFVLGLLTYEGAVVLPFLAVLMCSARVVRCRARRCRPQIAILFGILLIYAVLWNVLFGFRITRFPVEHTALAAVASLRNAIENCFHGSGRPWLAPFYSMLLWVIVRATRGPAVLLLASGWFLISFAPFLMVHGYADRFSYLASAAFASVIAFSLMAIHRRSAWIGCTAAAALIVFFAVGMQHRIATWRQAGEIARRIGSGIQQACDCIPRNATVVLLNAPSTYKQALVFLTGLDRAAALECPHIHLPVLRQARVDAPRPTLTFTYAGGRLREITFDPPP